MVHWTERASHPYLVTKGMLLHCTYTGETLDGKSLASVLHAPDDTAAADALKPWAMSQYMRCPKGNLSDYSQCLYLDFNHSSAMFGIVLNIMIY